MKLFELFNEAEGDIKTKDTRLNWMLKKARNKYSGKANDDLGALMNMMGDEQAAQDHEIDDLDHYNGSQDVEIDNTDHVNDDQESEIEDLQNRVDQLERGRGVSEEIVPTGEDDYPYMDDETGEVFPAGMASTVNYDSDYDIEDDEDDVEEPVDKVNYKLLAQKIEDAVQNTFPDGDPFDQLAHYADQLERNGTTLEDALNKAAKDYLGAANYNDYLADFWDDYAQDNLEPDERAQGNPWRESVEEATRRPVQQNWFETLNATLESEGLLNTWDGITMDPISYGENRSYNAVDDNGQCRHISIYRETDGRYERPVHYPTKGC